jgi:hypothetical protein
MRQNPEYYNFVGARKSVTLRSLRVLPNEAAETLAPHHPFAGHRHPRMRRPEWCRPPCWTGRSTTTCPATVPS